MATSTPASDGPFPSLPRTFVDSEGTTIAIEAGDDARDELVAMYADFAAGDRSRGTPPRDEDRIHRWVADLLDGGVNALARHGDQIVGHAVLLPFDDRAELAIFGTQAYQSAGIGSALLRALLGAGADAGLDRVWLCVERSNAAAVAPYRSIGFETTTNGLEVEMELTLGNDADGDRPV